MSFKSSAFSTSNIIVIAFMYPGMSSCAMVMLSLRSPIARTFPRVEYVCRGALLEAAFVLPACSCVFEQATAGATENSTPMARMNGIPRETEVTSMAVVYHPALEREMRPNVAAGWANPSTSWYWGGP